VTLDELAQKVNGDLVAAALRHDQVREALGRFDEFPVHGLEDPGVALHDCLCRPATFDDIALDDPDETLVRICIHEDLQVHHVAQASVDERHDTLNDDYRLWLLSEMEHIRSEANNT